MLKSLTARVLLAILVGIALGVLVPQQALACKLFSDIFVRLVRMVVAPIVFLTVVVGMAGMGDLRRVGRLGAKALLYFEVVTTVALGIGLTVALYLQPGRGFDVAAMQAHAHATPVAMGAPPHGNFSQLLLAVVPDNAVGAFAQGDMLPLLVFALLFGATLARLKSGSAQLVAACERLTQVFFGMIELIMLLSPLAAMGAMAYTVGQFGLGALWAQARLLGAVYLTMALFIGGVLAALARAFGFRLSKLLRHIAPELWLVLGTSSSESVLPRIMDKLQAAGCSKGVVGLVIPTGYAFNLDGTAIYLSMATLFIAQAYGVVLTPVQLLSTFGVLMLTSKGAAGVTGSGFVTLAATLTAMPDHLIPAEGVALVVGVDRFLSEARALTNLVGNCVATVVLAKWERAFVDKNIV